MSGFATLSEFSPSKAELQLLPMRFERLESGRVAIANLVGDVMLATPDELARVAALDIRPGDGLYERAYEKLLISGKGQRSQLQLLALRLRSRMSFLKAPTPLHIFVVTLRCEHSCPYCQVSRRSTDRAQYDMDEATALKALHIAFSSPAPRIKLEFQGGEPLLNFEIIKTIVLAAKARSLAEERPVDFVITSNLALLTDEVLSFCKEHNIMLSTSLDGPADLHNRNRPRPGGNSHQLAIKGIRRAKSVLGADRVGALMTTTQGSLGRVREIVDEYLKEDLDGIFLRPLSPYGFAVKTKQIARYDRDGWLDFYREGLRYVLEVNRSGRYFPEFYATLLLRRLTTDRPTGYVDLRSPAGTGLGALVYNYDGRVFASDEGRMLDEMGDSTFDLGHVDECGYSDLLLSDKLIGLVGDTLAQCAPQCSSCAYEPACGADPVFHHATQGDALGIKPLSDFCKRQKTVFGLLLETMEDSPGDAAIMRRWAS